MYHPSSCTVDATCLWGVQTGAEVLSQSSVCVAIDLVLAFRDEGAQAVLATPASVPLLDVSRGCGDDSLIALSTSASAAARAKDLSFFALLDFAVPHKQPEFGSRNLHQFPSHYC